MTGQIWLGFLASVNIGAVLLAWSRASMARDRRRLVEARSHQISMDMNLRRSRLERCAQSFPPGLFDDECVLERIIDAPLMRATIAAEVAAINRSHALAEADRQAADRRLTNRQRQDRDIQRAIDASEKAAARPRALVYTHARGFEPEVES